jgi:hypothetical protein
MKLILRPLTPPSALISLKYTASFCQSRHSEKKIGVRVDLTAVDPACALGGRPFGRGATRRLSALTI